MGLGSRGQSYMERKAGRGVAGPQQGREGLAPLQLLFHDLGAQIDAVFADVDTSRTGDEPAVPV